MVLCLVLGEEVTDRFIFDISAEMWTSMKISHLRDGIKEKASLSVPAHKIKLWKVAIPTKDINDEKMKILINKSHEFINVKEELGVNYWTQKKMFLLIIISTSSWNH